MKNHFSFTHFKFLYCALLLFLPFFQIPVHAHPQNQGPSFGVEGTGNAGISFGGSKLIRNEDSEISDSILAGERYLLNLGLLWHFHQNVKLQTTLGWHFDEFSTTNDNTQFSRFPLESIAYLYLTENIRIGSGISYHLSPTLYVDDSQAEDIEYDHAAGYTFELDFGSGNLFIGIRYTIIDYENSQSGEIIDGNHLGIILGEGF